MYDHNTATTTDVEEMIMAVIELVAELVVALTAAAAMLSVEAETVAVEPVVVVVVVVHETARTFPCVVHTSKATTSAVSSCSNNTGSDGKESEGR